MDRRSKENLAPVMMGGVQVNLFRSKSLGLGSPAHPRRGSTVELNPSLTFALSCYDRVTRHVGALV